MHQRCGLGIVMVTLHLLAAAVVHAADVPDGVWVREGYELTVAMTLDVPPRFITMDDAGTLYISHPRQGEIRAARDTDGDGVYDAVTIFVGDHPTVHGMQWHAGELWFTQTGAIHRARDTTGDYVADAITTVIPEGELPKGGGHWWRSILVHGGRLYTSIGDSGNITDETETERQKIWSFTLDGSDKQLFASGLRNTEKLVVRPGTDEVWGMDHGSDWFGRPLGDRPGKQPITDMNPPDEMNHYQRGGFYGHPFIVGNRLPRYEFMAKQGIIDLAEKTTPPAWSTGAHWAPNAMTFYTGEQFPAEIVGDAFVAFHGSWNRKVREGYQVARVLFEGGKPYGQLPMATFLTDAGKPLGRPVDVLVDRDGTLLISDDFGKRIYRLRYVGD